jgi:PAS domain S-box-containing protein
VITLFPKSANVASTSSSRSSLFPVTAAFVRYSLGVLAAVAALLLRKFLTPFFGEHNPYHTAWLAVVFAAWYCGMGPAILAVTITTIGIWYLFLPPTHSFAVKDVSEIAGLVGFLAFSAVVIILGESSRRSMAEREIAEEDLRRAHEELEHRVRERTAALHRRTAEVVEKATLLDLANDAIFTKDPNGTISYWNQGAERLYGWTAQEALGRDHAELLHTTFPIPLSEIEKYQVWEGELTHSTREGRRIVVASRWTSLRDEAGELCGWMEINTDITARKAAENAARSLSGRILTLQDDERRRIARGLHDSLGQYLAALKMQLGLLSMSNGDEPELIEQATEIVDRCLAETRTVSHLLHPPLLDEAGFGSAARWFVEGFAKRSGVAVDLRLPPNLGRLHSDVEITLFRALQEGLTNVHRHSGSPRADISVSLEPTHVRLDVQDYGQGMPSHIIRELNQGDGKTGVGIAGMRERVRELGGYMAIKSSSHGTLLSVLVPLIEISNVYPDDSQADEQVPAA